MSDYIVKDTELTSVANAIRTKGGTNLPLVFPNGFVTAVNNIGGGGGSSDFSTAEVTYTTNPTHPLYLAILYNDEIMPAEGGSFTVPSGTYTFVLYKGKAFLHGFEADFLNMEGNSTSGNITYDATNMQYVVTGDFTFQENNMIIT